MAGLKKWILPALYLLLILGFSSISPARAEVIAFTRVNLVPMTDDRVRPNQTVIVQDGFVQTIGFGDRVKIPAGAHIINGQGKFLLPGLCDMHVHIRSAWPKDILQLYIAQGVTTIRDLNGRPRMLAWKREIQQGGRIGPNLLVAAPTIYGFEPRAWTLVKKNHAERYDCVKVYAFHSPDSQRKTLSRAKDLGKWTVGHNSIQAGLQNSLDWGLEEVAHLEELAWELITYDHAAKHNPREWYVLFIQKLTELAEKKEDRAITDKMGSILKLLQTHQTVLNTTLAVTEAMDLKVNHLEQFLNLSSSRFLPPEYLLSLRAGLDKHQQMLAGREAMAPVFLSWLKKSLKMAVAGGLLVTLGTDSGGQGLGVVPGFSLHDELRLAQGAGLSPYQVLVLATRNAGLLAQRMGQGEAFGTIEPGRRADLLLVEGNPLADLANAAKINGVMIRGRWFNRQALDRMLEPPPKGKKAPTAN